MIIFVNFGNLLGDFQTRDNFAKGCVLAIQPEGVANGNEELAAGRITILGIPGHGNNAFLMFESVFKAVGAEFSRNKVTGIAQAGSQGTAPLNHKAGDDPVKNQSVIETLLGQGNKVANSIGSNVGIEFNFNNAAAFHFDGGQGIGVFFFFLRGTGRKSQKGQQGEDENFPEQAESPSQIVIVLYYLFEWAKKQGE